MHAEEILFSGIFHESSKDNAKGHPPISTDVSEWPTEWKNRHTKSYPRFPKIALSHEKPSADFFSLIESRRSSREYSRQPVSLRDLGILLKYSCGVVQIDENGIGRRAQPSGGGRFPLEVYVVVSVPGQDLPSGLYHYDVEGHQLDILWKREFSADDMKAFFSQDWMERASFVVFITAAFGRTQAKYGERGYRYVLLEAGHVGQNMYLAAQALGIGCCALGGTHDAVVEKLLDVDGVRESLVYSIGFGS
jgi:SagB-type dehydrogenase family enzyme